MRCAAAMSSSSVSASPNVRMALSAGIASGLSCLDNWSTYVRIKERPSADSCIGVPRGSSIQYRSIACATSCARMSSSSSATAPSGAERIDSAACSASCHVSTSAIRSETWARADNDTSGDTSPGCLLTLDPDIGRKKRTSSARISGFKSSTDSVAQADKSTAEERTIMARTSSLIFNMSQYEDNAIDGPL